MSPTGNGPTVRPNEVNHKFKIFSADDESLNNSIEMVNKSRVQIRKDKVCVVSVIGKSSLSANNSKASLVDQSMGKNVFRGLFCQMNTFFEESNCQIDGYYDVRNKVIFLHLTSVWDSLAMTQICKSIEKDIYEKGFLQVWPDLQQNLCKALLLLFHLSHIVVIVNPSPHFDLNHINMFRILDSTRLKLLPHISECLQAFGSLPTDWIQSGRPCSPRALFVFESYENILLSKEKLRNSERQLEDQIYRILRKSRVITNISANSLFAVSTHNDYVYISSKDPTIRDSSRYLLERLIKYCNSEDKNESEDSSDEGSDSDSQTFYSFLWTHIGIAHSKGFDDNIGRHAAPPIFELPTAKEFFQIALKLKDLLFAPNVEISGLKTIFNSLHTSLDIDTRFSESRCAKILPLSLATYQDALPPHYTRDFHERKLAHTLEHFTRQARGPALYDYCQRLKIECDNYWQNGRQMCEVLSLTGNHCINPIHRLKSEDDINDSEDSNDSDTESEPKLPAMRHLSAAKIISACDCGRRQANRDDPFSVKAANYDFYAIMRNKCSCGHLERVLFPVFESSSDNIQPARTVPLPKSPIHSKTLNTPFDTSLTPGISDIPFESQPDAGVSSFTNLSQQVSADINTDLMLDELHKSNANTKEDDNKIVGQAVEASDEQKTDPQLEQRSEQLVKQLVDDDNDQTSTSSEDDGSEYYNDIDDNDIQLVIRESESPYLASFLNQSSTTEYLPGMLHSMSPPGLLPKYSSWSLVCLGPSSLYSHNIGLQEQPGFISGANFLLPWDVTVKLEHSGHLPPLWEGKRPPGIKNKKTFKDGTQFTVKIFIGVEYECHRGHRFIASGPDSVLKASLGIVKESANRVASNDMPLYFPCVCNRTGKPHILAQLMRIHLVTPKAPVNVTVNPRVQPAPMPCPIFYAGNAEPVRLSQSTYWLLRLPMIYEGECGPYTVPKDQLPLESCRLLKGTYGIADYISKPKTIN